MKSLCYVSVRIEESGMDRFLVEPSKLGKPVIGVWNSVADSWIAEAIATLGPDYVCVDMQHGATDISQLVGQFQGIVAGGSIPIARVPECSPAIIMKTLDAGARGVIIPLIESGEEARLAVSACLFPPVGQRSFGPFRAGVVHGSREPSMLEEVACIVQVETRAGVENLEEIVGTDGVTAVYIGPSDLSLALGLPPNSIDSPEFISVIDRIREVCDNHKVVAGIHCYDGNDARRMIERGFGMVTVAVDLMAFRRALGIELDRARGIS